MCGNGENFAKAAMNSEGGPRPRFNKSWLITANFEIRNYHSPGSIECFELADIVEDSLI